VITDYSYDLMNRLDTLTHYGPDGTPLDLSDNPVLARFDYERYADGMKSGATETDAQGRVSTFSWDYDNVGRLVREVYDSADDSLDYATGYVFDLVGNRLEKATDRGLEGTVDETLLRPALRDYGGQGEGGVATEETVYAYGVGNSGQ
jgi:hypothetical protein